MSSVRAELDTSEAVIGWLLAGDPAIRWQVLRDLQDAPAGVWQVEQQRTLDTGWGAALLAQQAPDGSWGGGIYTPKWTSTTYTLLNLCAIGIPGSHDPARRGAALMLDRQFGPHCDPAFAKALAACDRCIVGMGLQIAATFGPADERVEAIVENLLAERMSDGGWNCRRHRKPQPHHSSFHTTLNVLEGLRAWLAHTPNHALRGDVLQAEQGALALLLDHRLFRSDKTGAIIDPRFLNLTYPHYWHYTVLRALDYFAQAGTARDPRLGEAVDWLVSSRHQDGTWPVHGRYQGKLYFDMEKIGSPSRWNTLRARRILRWWEGTAPI